MDNKASFVSEIERRRARSGVSADFYAQALEASREFRREYRKRTRVVKSQDMPMERTADGLIKHIVNEGMNTTECCIDVHMQFIPANGATGTSRHLSEEIAFVIEGRGYDLHYDVSFRCEANSSGSGTLPPGNSSGDPETTSIFRRTARTNDSTSNRRTKRGSW